MMMFELFVPYEPNDTPKDKFIKQIIGCEANRIFEHKVIDILSEKYPNIDEWDLNTWLTIEGHEAVRDTAFECGYKLKRLYESIFNEKISEETENRIKEVAGIFAEIPLKKFGWIKEEKGDSPCLQSTETQ